MLTYFLAEQNLPFSVSIALVLAMAALEGVLTLLGFGLSAMLDGLGGDLYMPAIEADADVSADFDAADGSALSFGSLLAWLRFGEVPAIILLIIFLSAFGALGFAVQGAVSSVAGTYLPSAIAAVPAFAGALPVVRILGGAMGRLMPREETSAVALETLIGRVARITLGTATVGRPAQGKVRDQHGLDHYVMIEPDTDNTEFSQGSEVLLVRKAGATFFAIANEHDALRR